MLSLKLVVAGLMSVTLTPALICAQEGAPSQHRATAAVGNLVPGQAASVRQMPHLTLSISGDRSGPRAVPWAVSTNRLGVSTEPIAAVDAAAITSALGSSVLPQARRRRAPGVALMLVGAAGLLTGLIVDESAITIAGAAVAGIGLYLYLR